MNTFFHHDKDFVQKVLAYIYASKDGLSENELLELLNTDEDFIQKLAPDTWHINTNKELPLVIWTRLYTQLKPFLSKKNQDNEELLFFFHREFEYIVKKNENHRKEHENLIGATQKLIFKNQDTSFLNNRWGELYQSIIFFYRVKWSKNPSVFFEYSLFISKLKNELWIESYFRSSLNKAYMLYQSKIYHYAIIKLDYLQHLTLLKSNNNKWKLNYLIVLSILVKTYNLNKKYSTSLMFAEKAFKQIEYLYIKNKKDLVIIKLYIEICHTLSGVYIHLKKYRKGLDLYKNTIYKIENRYISNPSRWVYEYVYSLINIAEIYRKLKNNDQSLLFDNKAVEIITPFYKKEPEKWEDLYSISINHLADSYRKNNKVIDSIPLGKISLQIRKKLFLKNPYLYTEEYVIALINLGVSYRKTNKFIESYKLNLEAVNILKPLFKQNPNAWDLLYTESLFYLNDILHSTKKNIECINNSEFLLKILKKLYYDKPTFWEDKYDKLLRNLSIYYYEIKKYSNAKKIIKQRISTINQKNDLECSKVIESFNILKLIHSKENNIEKVNLINFIIGFYEIKNKLTIDYEKWIHKYLSHIKKISSYYYSKNEISEALKYNNMSIVELESLYNENNHWRKQFIDTIKEQLLYYLEIGDKMKLEKLKIKYKNILQMNRTQNIPELDTFIALELMKENQISTINDAKIFLASTKDGVSHNVDDDFFKSISEIISLIKKTALSKMELRFQQYQKQENSLFRRTREYQQFIIEEINNIKLPKGKLFIHKLKKKFGFNN